MRSVALLLAAGGMVLGGAGCQKPEASLVPVEGVIVLDGQALPGLYVQFLPDAYAGTVGQRSAAYTDDQGRFKLKCDNQQEGAVVGKHRVVLEDTRRVPPPQGSDAPPPPGRIHQHYQEAAFTPLIIEVPAGGSKELKIELEKSPPRGSLPTK